jgi:hypothetical protein
MVIDKASLRAIINPSLDSEKVKLGEQAFRNKVSRELLKLVWIQ